MPLGPKIEACFWYQSYFLTERGRAGLSANRRDLARLMLTRNSPNWRFDDATFERSATVFDNPDYVDVVIHSYRHRLGAAPGYPEYEELERKLAAQPVITVPAITLDGDADGVVPATDGISTAAKFMGGRSIASFRKPATTCQEDPAAFVAAVQDLTVKSGMTQERSSADRYLRPIVPGPW